VETAEFLGKVDLFKFLKKDALELLAAQMRLVQLPAGPIIRENDPADGLYIIKSGLARVSTSAKDEKSEAVLAVLRPGNAFGELALIDGAPRSATITALQPVECYFLPREAFLDSLGKHPEIALGMLPAVTAMVRAADKWIGSLI
jgi:CRP-like cAMP-binding protein